MSVISVFTFVIKEEVILIYLMGTGGEIPLWHDSVKQLQLCLFYFKVIKNWLERNDWCIYILMVARSLFLSQVICFHEHIARLSHWDVVTFNLKNIETLSKSLTSLQSGILNIKNKISFVLDWSCKCLFSCWKIRRHERMKRDCIYHSALNQNSFFPQVCCQLKKK